MKKILKNPLFHTNILLLILAVLLFANTTKTYAESFDFVKTFMNKVIAASNNITSPTGGTLNYLTSFVGADSPSYDIGDSIIYDSGTNIGISTASPGAKLDVNAGSDNLLRLRQGANPATTFRVGTDGAMVIDNDGISNVLTLNGGNVGVGNTSPADTFQVGSGGDTTGKRMRATSDSGDISIFVQGSAEVGAHAGYGRASKIIGQQTAYPLVISNNVAQAIVFGTSDTERMRITGAGNVGIGTASPQAPLHVNGSVILEPLASDPSSPVNGQIWIRQ